MKTYYSETLGKKVTVPEGETKQTPGPWELVKGQTGQYRILAGKGSIAGSRIVITDLDCYTSDARLIAASPELLKACKEAIEGLYVEHAENCVDPDCPYLQTYNKLSDVIAKAEGGE